MQIQNFLDTVLANCRGALDAGECFTKGVKDFVLSREFTAGFSPSQYSQFADCFNRSLELSKLSDNWPSAIEEMIHSCKDAATLPIQKASLGIITSAVASIVAVRVFFCMRNR